MTNRLGPKKYSTLFHPSQWRFYICWSGKKREKNWKTQTSFVSAYTHPRISINHIDMKHKKTFLTPLILIIRPFSDKMDRTFGLIHNNLHKGKFSNNNRVGFLHITPSTSACPIHPRQTMDNNSHVREYFFCYFPFSLIYKT